MDRNVEHEICANCKKEIPHFNYVMHTAHCARNISLCPVCKEPIPKSQFEEHREKHSTNVRKVDEKVDFPRQVSKTSIKEPVKAKDVKYGSQYSTNNGYSLNTDSAYSLRHSPSPLNNNTGRYSPRNSVDSYGLRQSPRNNVENANSLQQSQYSSDSSYSLKQPEQKETKSGVEKKQNVVDNASKAASYEKPKPKSSSLLACKYCDLELPKLDLEEHENYCGARTDKCNECGEIVMYKYKKLHEETNHGFLKLNDEPGPRPTWDSDTQRPVEPSYLRRQRPAPIYTVNSFDFSPLYSSYSNYSSSSLASEDNGEKRESYKDISRRLDWPAPQPPHRRPNPPTELLIPCEFCHTPVPHEELIEHETGCRPDLARFNPRRRSPSPDDYFIAPEPSSPDVELPCEFCADMFPASELLRHQATCT